MRIRACILGMWRPVCQETPRLRTPATTGANRADWGAWGAPSTRGWHAQVLWQALDSYWGVDRVP